MIETKVEVSKDLEKALRVLQQAKQRVANEKKTELKSRGNVFIPFMGVRTDIPSEVVCAPCTDQSGA